jgi:citrate lyase subunit beta/citryl-CoA lyase
VIDLEDAVVPAEKDAAREAVATALLAPAWSGVGVAVRVNAPRSPWCHLDLAALAALPDLPASVVVPKVESAADLAFVERLLDGLEAAAGRSQPLGVQALIETAAGVAAVAEIAAASSRLEALILGYADLAASLGRGPAEEVPRDAWLPAQEAVLVAARANGLQAIDGPYLGTSPDQGFEAAARRAAALGFDGKWAIHPSQVEPLNQIFTPATAAIERARAVIEALAAAEREGAGAIALDGEMLDEAVRVAAARVLARAGAAGLG